MGGGGVASEFDPLEIMGLAADEVARDLGMTRGAVYVAKSRVLARLRKEVQLRLSETGVHASLAAAPQNSVERGDR